MVAHVCMCVWPVSLAPRVVAEKHLQGMADQIFVNSRFTAGVFAAAFPLLRGSWHMLLQSDSLALPRHRFGVTPDVSGPFVLTRSLCHCGLRLYPPLNLQDQDENAKKVPMH